MSTDRAQPCDKEGDCKSGGLVVAIVLIALVLLPLLYMLSLGPAVMVYYDKEPPPWLESFYAPVDWLINQSQVADRALSWYRDLWIPDDP